MASSFVDSLKPGAPSIHAGAPRDISAGWAEKQLRKVVSFKFKVIDCQKAVGLISASKHDTSYDQGMIDFIKGNNKAAIDSWQKVIQKDPAKKHDLQPWIEKAKARLTQ